MIIEAIGPGAVWRGTRRGIAAVRAGLQARLNRVAPKFPAIDVHTHLNSPFAGRWRRRDIGRVLAALDRAGVERMVDLDGAWGAALSAELDRTRRLGGPDRVAVFAGVDMGAFQESPRFGDVEAARLRDSVARGARGVKVWKALGLEAVDGTGRLVAIDDERLSPLWDAAADLGVPVLIHVADPPPFFQPLGRENERREELARHPEWHFWPTRAAPDLPGFPSHAELIDQFERLLERHRSTTFIGAHLASCGDDLARLGSMLQRHPNLHVDIAARINELGRQPERARQFIIAFADRVLFGTDAGPDPRAYAIYVRFLETATRDMSYSVVEPPQQGNWRVHGLSLPDPVLELVYAANARRLIRFLD